MVQKLLGETHKRQKPSEREIGEPGVNQRNQLMNLNHSKRLLESKTSSFLEAPVIVLGNPQIPHQRIFQRQMTTSLWELVIEQLRRNKLNLSRYSRSKDLLSGTIRSPNLSSTTMLAPFPCRPYDRFGGTHQSLLGIWCWPPSWQLTRLCCNIGIHNIDLGSLKEYKLLIPRASCDFRFHGYSNQHSGCLTLPRVAAKFKAER